MCFKFGGGGSYRSASTDANDEEKKDTAKAAKKQRLLETEGKENGQQLTNKQIQSVRRIFGN